MKEILVLGGGASGLAAAIAAAQTGGGRVRVTLLEQNPAPGKKLLATGNGRCNFDNLASSEPGRYFTAAPGALAGLLAAIDGADLPAWWEGLGLLHRADEAGRLYPYSNQAADLTGLLLGWLEALGVSVQAGCRVLELGQKGRSYAVQAEREGRRQLLTAQNVICALGGSAGPQFGTGGFGPALARRAGGKVEPLYPCLTPLRCGDAAVLKPLVPNTGCPASASCSFRGCWRRGAARRTPPCRWTCFPNGRKRRWPAFWPCGVGESPPCPSGRGCWTAVWGTLCGKRPASPAACPPS